jgi:hypothetical protein
MTLALHTDPAAILRATGIVRSVCAGDDDHVNAVMEATLDAALGDPDDLALMRTFAALVAMAAVMAAALHLADVYPDIDHALDAIARQLIAGDVPPATGKDT